MAAPTAVVGDAPSTTFSLFELLTPLVVERYWSHVDRRAEDECWPWAGARCPRGYGRFHPVKPITSGANRVALTLALGRDIKPGLFALHHCDNPPCCNPRCLYEGDHDQNMADKVARSRQRKGESVPSSVLSAATVVVLRERFARGDTITSLAAEYDIALGTASKIVNGVTWTHVAGPIRIPGQRGRRPASERSYA